ncbi:hypothetical protein A2U01_0091631, partial [Trifolium medium]|nr:hypothetical protein [Trifolium medium]
MVEDASTKATNRSWNKRKPQGCKNLCG